jgi:tetrahydromethanopterin S-methyltransferase subunit F
MIGLSGEPMALLVKVKARMQAAKAPNKRLTAAIRGQGIIGFICGMGCVCD